MHNDLELFCICLASLRPANKSYSEKGHPNLFAFRACLKILSTRSNHDIFKMEEVFELPSVFI